MKAAIFLVALAFVGTLDITSAFPAESAENNAKSFQQRLLKKNVELKALDVGDLKKAELEKGDIELNKRDADVNQLEELEEDEDGLFGRDLGELEEELNERYGDANELEEIEDEMEERDLDQPEELEDDDVELDERDLEDDVEEMEERDLDAELEELTERDLEELENEDGEEETIDLAKRRPKPVLSPGKIGQLNILCKGKCFRKTGNAKTACRNTCDAACKARCETEFPGNRDCVNKCTNPFNLYPEELAAYN